MKPLETLGERLVKLAEDTPWEAFEEKPDGHLQLSRETKHGKFDYDFYLRVGLHLGRPMEVIIAHNNFIRFRKEERWPLKQWQLKKVDPSKPMDCLYLYPYSYHQSAGANPWIPGWPTANVAVRGYGGGYIQSYPTAAYPTTVYPQSGYVTASLPQAGWRPDTGFPDYSNQQYSAQLLQQAGQIQSPYWQQTHQIGGVVNPYAYQQQMMAAQSPTTNQTAAIPVTYDSQNWTGNWFGKIFGSGW